MLERVQESSANNERAGRCFIPRLMLDAVRKPVNARDISPNVIAGASYQRWSNDYLASERFLMQMPRSVDGGMRVGCCEG
jgi:hypothetical protein